MSQNPMTRLMAALAVSATLSAVALVLAAPAGATTIYACVRKHSGVTRIVSRTAKCKHSEQHLSWSVTGPAGSPGAAGPKGANGANGTNGTAGSPGAVAGFPAGNFGPVPMDGKSLIVLVSEVLPPGSFIVSGKTVLSGHALAASTVAAECAMFDTPGTEAGTGEAIDSGAWGAALIEGIGEHFNAFATIPFAGGFTSSVTTTLDLACAASASVNAEASHITAVQTSINS
ncbi:MAG TPA: collagen-like protein [Solirubrobacteraceae bacterium]